MSAHEKAGSGWHPTGFQNNISRADSTPSRSTIARDVLRDTIVAAGVSALTGTAILAAAAADGYAKARVRDELDARARAAEQNHAGASA